MNQEPIILYKFASRGRPEKFQEAVDRIILTQGENTNYVLLVSIDLDDPCRDQYQRILVKISRLFDGFELPPKMIYSIATSANKIHAINRDVHEPKYVDFKGNIFPNWHILVNMSDDMLLENSFAATVRTFFSDLQQYDAFLHLPDGFTNERLCTLSIMGHTYFERFGYIYHPSYKSVYCDNEAMEVAKILGCYHYVDEPTFTHAHPANVGSQAWDERYAVTENSELYKVDEQNYLARKARNFDIHLVKPSCI
jgi:hypothetical protein